MRYDRVLPPGTTVKLECGPGALVPMSSVVSPLLLSFLLCLCSNTPRLAMLTTATLVDAPLPRKKGVGHSPQ